MQSPLVRDRIWTAAWCAVALAFPWSNAFMSIATGFLGLVALVELANPVRRDSEGRYSLWSGLLQILNWGSTVFQLDWGSHLHSGLTGGTLGSLFQFPWVKRPKRFGISVLYLSCIFGFNALKIRSIGVLCCVPLSFKVGLTLLNLVHSATVSIARAQLS